MLWFISVRITKYSVFSNLFGSHQFIDFIHFYIKHQENQTYGKRTL